MFDNYENRGTAAKTAEMNILNHMQYGHDMKIRPETIKRMGKVEPEVNINVKEDFIGPYSRANESQRALYDPILKKINDDFESKWPLMNDREKLSWKYQRYMQDYLACISSVDDNIGRLLNYLEENNLAENTIIVYTSDQGFYLGEHGWFDKRFIYDESFKTPLLVRWPNVIKAGTTSDEMVQNLDFAQTLLEIAGITAPSDMQGESLVPLFKGQNEKWTRDAVYYHYYEYPGIHMVKRHYGIVTQDYKLVHFYNDVDEWELYDRKKDPQEMMNVINDLKYTDVVNDLKVRLSELQIKYKEKAIE